MGMKNGSSSSFSKIQAFISGKIAVQHHFEILGNRLVVSVSGGFDADDSVSKFESILLFCRTGALDRVLIDFRELEKDSFATADLLYAYNVAGIYERYLAEGGEPLKMAYVGPPTYGTGSIPAVRVARESGLDVILTSEMSEAMDWLDCDNRTANV